MKTVKIFLQAISYLLAFVILLQGCTVYKSSAGSIDQAIQAQTQVRIEKKNGEIEKYNEIIRMDDGEIYGKRLTKNQSKQFFKLVAIEEEQINKIQLKDKTASTLVTLAIPVAIIVVIIAKLTYDLNHNLLGG